jgi:hypothetical protein
MRHDIHGFGTAVRNGATMSKLDWVRGVPFRAAVLGSLAAMTVSVVAQTTSSRIVFTRGYDIWKMKDDGTEETQLTNTTDGEFRPSICPSGRNIVFERSDNEDLEGQAYVVWNCEGRVHEARRERLGDLDDGRR